MSTFSSSFLTNLLSVQRSQRSLGFTMIELLIVITILGFLAVAVLSAINPVEQINRGRDTTSRSDAEQMISAVDRYYAFNGYYPWQTSANATTGGPTALAWADFTSTAPVDNSTTGCPIGQKLSQGNTAGTCSGADELKSTFINRVTQSSANPLKIYNNGTQGDSTYVCFAPKSKAFKDEAWKRCVDSTGSGLPSDIDNATKALICVSATASYSCLP